MISENTISAPQFAKTEIGIFLIYLFCCIANMRTYLNGRFWAEEGRDFYTSLLHQPISSIITHTHHGHLQLVTNAVVYLSTKVPLLYAPVVTTYLSLAIQSLPVLLIIAFRRQLQLAPWALLAFVILLVGMPQADEVQSNSINLHFHLTLLAVVIMLLSRIEGNWRFLFRGLLLICGLGGIPPNILLPVFVVKALLERDRESLIQALIVCFTTIVQIIFLLYSTGGLSARQIEFVPVFAVIATLAQQFISPFSSLILFDDWASWLRALTSHRLQAIGLAAIILTAILCFYAWCISAGPKYTKYLIIAILGLVAISSATAIGPKIYLIADGSVNGRYFFAPNALLFLVCCTVCSRLPLKNAVSGIVNRNSLIVLGLMLLVFTSLGVGLKIVSQGPDWPTALSDALAEHAGQVAIWPNGWKMRINNLGT